MPIEHPSETSHLESGKNKRKPKRSRMPLPLPINKARRAHAFLMSFVYAYFGILQVLATQRNMMVHCLIAIPILLASQLLDFSPIENILVLLCVALVLASELINTAIEQLGDFVSLDYHPAIGRAKDAAAAMVLISAIGAAAIGIILFTSDQRFHRLLRWDVKWQWSGSIDSVMIKLVFVGICWLFFHSWICRRRGVLEKGHSHADHPDVPSLSKKKKK